MLRLRQNWLLWAGLACAGLAAVYAGLRAGAALPPDGGQIVYPLTLIYNYSALPASIVVLLGALALLFYWLPQAWVRAPGFRRGGLLVLVALIAAAGAIWAALPLGRLIYRELASATAAGRTYHLGVRVSGDPTQNAYVLCECPGLVCTCQYLYDPSLNDLQSLPELKVDAAQHLTVQVAGRLLYERAP